MAIFTPPRTAPLRSLGLGLLLAATAGLCVVAAIAPARPSATNPTATGTTCPPPPSVIDLTFTDHALEPEQVTAHVCDRLVFHNATSSSIEIAFGPHSHHITYPGLIEAPLPPGATTSLTLTRSGTFPIHDHLHDALHAALVIQPFHGRSL